MGLDMYLRAEKYVSEYSGQGDEGKKACNAIMKAAGFTPSDNGNTFLSVSVELTVAYWRKANAIHKWFVDNVQDGKDECQKSYVSREQLEALLSVVEVVLKNREEAPKLLPTESGFFFGSVEYGEWYWEDLEDTKKQLKKVLNNPRLKGCDLYYQASW